MALWHCRGCGAAYAVGLPCCPQCHSTDYSPEDQAMGKISRTGEATGGPDAPAVTDGPDGGAEDGTGTESAPGTAETPDSEEAEGAEAPAADGPVPVADQIAAGVSPDETVTIAAQKAGAEPPPIPPAAAKAAPPPPPKTAARKAADGG